MVSIPIGFSSSLQPILSRRSESSPSLFQSLSGFQVRCNSCRSCQSEVSAVVSIPIGFSSSLQQPVGRPDLTSLLVSIPIGFSSSLQRAGALDRYFSQPVSIPIGFSSSLQRYHFFHDRYFRTSFNPYRVFKFVATQLLLYFRSIMMRFQSLSGFQVRCNTLPKTRAGQYHNVSIPIGFSSSLQRPDRAPLEDP